MDKISCYHFPRACVLLNAALGAESAVAAIEDPSALTEVSKAFSTVSMVDVHEITSRSFPFDCIIMLVPRS